MSLNDASTNAVPASNRRTAILLAAILFVALAFRLGWVWVIDPAPQLEGGDGPFYLILAENIAAGTPISGTFSAAAGPGYPLYLALFYLLMPDDAVVLGARLGQAALDGLMCVIAFDIARRIFDARVGVLAGLILALDLRFVVQAAAITTETVFTFLVVLGVWLFVVARAAHERRWLGYAASAAVLFMSALTRPAGLPLPFLLVASLLLPRPTRQQLIVVSLALLAGLGAIAAHSIYQYQRTGVVVIISDGLGGNFWMGSKDDGQWHGSAAFQAELEDLKQRYGGRAAYLEDAFRTIAGDPPAYARLLGVKLARAYLQPHGTVSFPGESLKELAVQVVRGELGVVELVTGDAFWPKLIIYIFHFTGLIGGLLGLWLARRDWLKVLPLVLPIVYFTLAYLLLTIIPRYIFPIMPFYMLLAAYAGVEVFRRYRKSKS